MLSVHQVIYYRIKLPNYLYNKIQNLPRFSLELWDGNRGDSCPLFATKLIRNLKWPHPILNLAACPPSTKEKCLTTPSTLYTAINPAPQSVGPGSAVAPSSRNNAGPKRRWGDDGGSAGMAILPSAIKTNFCQVLFRFTAMSGLNVANFALIPYLRVMHAWATPALVGGGPCLPVAAFGSQRDESVIQLMHCSILITAPGAEWAQII